MRYARILGVIVTLGVVALALAGVVANAQDSPELRCDADELDAQLQWTIDTLTAAQNGTPAEQYQALIEVRIALVALDAECLILANSPAAVLPDAALTATAIESFFSTYAAITPTPNMTQTLAPCIFDYIVVQPETYDQPPIFSDTGNPRLIPAGAEFQFDLIFENTGNCDWPDAVRLTYNERLTQSPDNSVNLEPLQAVCAPDEIRPGVNFAEQGRSNFFIDGRTKISEESSVITFSGQAPGAPGCYYSIWDVLYPNSDVSIGRPLVLTIRVWGNN